MEDWHLLMNHYSLRISNYEDTGFLKMISLVDWGQVLMSYSDMCINAQYSFTKFLMEALVRNVKCVA